MGAEKTASISGSTSARGGLQVAELCQAEEERVLDSIDQVVDIHVMPVIPRDGSGPDAQPQILKAAVIPILRADVGDEVKCLFEVNLVSGGVFLPNVELDEMWTGIYTILILHNQLGPKFLMETNWW